MMAIDPLLIERIYEAAALPEQWPAVLQDIADRAGAKGAVITARSPAGVTVLPSPKLEVFLNDFEAEGWAADPELTAPLLAGQYPGFCTQLAYRSLAEIEALPVYQAFLLPRGLIAAAGTAVQGARDDAIHLSIDGFSSHEAAECALPSLDDLRAPLARALSLTTRLRDAKAANAVGALDLAGLPAAIVSPDRRLRAANDRFTQRLGNRMIDGRIGLRFADRFLQAQFAEALATVGTGAGSSRSIGVAATDDHAAFAIHLLPLRRAARDVFGWDGVLLLLAEAANTSVPGADLLRLLFDLTPAEARLTRYLVEGRTAGETATLLGITDATIRVHLRRIFAKTGARRQTELVRLLLGLGVAECG